MSDSKSSGNNNSNNNNNGNSGNSKSNGKILIGTLGNDVLNGTAGNDWLIGLSGDDKLFGGAGNDVLAGGAGNDFLDGGSGCDWLDGGTGNDVLSYRMAENARASDRYDGGTGTDTLRLELTSAEYARADVKADIARFNSWLNSHQGDDSRCHGDNDGWFEFRVFDLDVRRIEKLDLRVDGAPPGTGDRPVDAVNDAFSVNEGGLLSASVLANDSVPDGVRSVALLTGPAHGTLTFNPNGTFSFAPGAYFESLAQGETATESFSYRLTDTDGDSDTASVAITILGVNDAPVAADDAAALIVTLVQQTVDFEGATDPANVNGYSLPSFHVLPVFGVGGSSAAYAEDYNNSIGDGADGAIRRADGKDFALLSLDIAAYAASHEVSIVGFDNGVEVASRTLATLGTVAASGGLSGYTTITFDASWSSIDEVRFYAPSTGLEFTFIDNVRLGLAAGGEDSTADIAVLANDTDVDHGAVVTVLSVDATSLRGATLSLNADGSVHYDPTRAAAIQALDEGESLQDRFNYVARDEHNATDPATVTVTVFGRNDAPTVQNESISATDNGVAVTGNVLANDSDKDIEPISVLNPGSYSLDHGTLDIAADGSYSYVVTDETLGVGDVAQDVYSYSVSDGDATTAGVLTLNLTGANDAPTAVADSAGIVVDTTLGFEGVFDTSNVAGYKLPGFFSVDNFGVGGSWMVYAEDWSDAIGGADGAIQRVDGQDFTLFSLDIAAWVNAHGVTIVGFDDGVQVASVEVAMLDTVSESGGLTGYTSLTFDASWAGIDQVRFYAPHDRANHTLIDNVHLSAGTIVSEDAASNINVVANDTDVDAHDVLAVSSFQALSVKGAAISLNPDGTLRYDPTGSVALQNLADGETVEDRFGYTVGDGHGGSSSATVTVTVLGVTDASLQLWAAGSSPTLWVNPDGAGSDFDALATPLDSTSPTLDGSFANDYLIS
jgi:VCBS repeat-containing protein